MSIAIAKFLAGILVCNTLTDLLQEKSFGNIHDNENKKIERVIDAIILFSLIQSIVNVIVSIATTYRHSLHLKKGMELYEKHGNNYGGARNITAAIIPADFIISPSKIIKVAHYGDFVGDHLQVKDIEQNLKKNNTRF